MSEPDDLSIVEIALEQLLDRRTYEADEEAWITWTRLASRLRNLEAALHELGGKEQREYISKLESVVEAARIMASEHTCCNAGVVDALEALDSEGESS